MTRLLAHLRAEEGYRRHPYTCTGGFQTVGWGRNLETVGISEAEAETLARNDVARVEADMDRRLPWWRTVEPEARRCALVAMAYQLGVSGLMRFRKLLEAASRGLWARAADEALDSSWAKQTPQRAARVAGMIRTGRWPEGG